MNINNIKTEYRVQFKPTKNHVWHGCPEKFTTNFVEAVQQAIEAKKTNYAVRISETAEKEYLIP